MSLRRGLVHGRGEGLQFDAGRVIFGKSICQRLNLRDRCVGETFNGTKRLQPFFVGLPPCVHIFGLTGFDHLKHRGAFFGVGRIQRIQFLAIQNCSFSQRRARCARQHRARVAQRFWIHVSF